MSRQLYVDLGKPVVRGQGPMRRYGQVFHFEAWVGALLALLIPACSQGLGAFQTGVGNTPNSPPLAAFRVLGQFGTQFSALVYDTDASWTVTGTIPMNVIIVNNQTPVKMIATKLSNGNGILSLQLTLGFTVEDVASTNDPYGTASIQNAPTAPGFTPPPPPANPDVRLFVKGPLSERFSGLIEPTVSGGTTQGFILSDRVPALVLYENPQQPVDATLMQIQNLGPFNADLLVGGMVVAHVTGAPDVTIVQP